MPRYLVPFACALALAACADPTTDTGCPDANADAGTAGSTKGRLKLAVGVGGAKVKSLTVTLDGTAVPAFATKPATGEAPAFSAGTADDGVEVEPGLHRFEVTLVANLNFCRNPSGECDGITVEGRQARAIDLTVTAGQEQTAVVVFRVENDGRGTEQLRGHVAHFDSTPATSGPLAGVARLLFVREHSVLFDGDDTITFAGGPEFVVHADDDAVLTIPANNPGTLAVAMSQFVGPVRLSGEIPAIPAGRALPVVQWNDLTIPGEQAGSGKNLSK